MTIACTSIETSRLIIETFTEDLLTEKYISWLNNPIVVKYSRQRHKQHTLEECKQYFLSFARSNNLFFAIKLKENKSHIGNISITVDQINAVADISIMIGERSCWGKGYGFESWKAMCDFLIHDKTFRKVTGGCYSTNESMKNIMIKSGMEFDGIRKNHVLVQGVPVDLIYYALFNQSWGI